MKSFAELQAGLAPALAANTPGSGIPHVVVALPSYSVGESLLSHYAERVPALEHRYLLAGQMVHRITDCEIVYLCSVAPTAEVVEYYRTLGPRPEAYTAHTRYFPVADTSSRCLADKLLDRPDLIEQLRRHFGARPVVIEPWNVTQHEVWIAEQLQAPMNGVDPALRHLGFKSAGRRLFLGAGVPVPYGYEDVRTVDDVVAAIEAIRAARPQVAGVVVKHDDSGAGDGNVVISVREASNEPAATEAIRRRVEALPEWYLTDLRDGGVVEELITGTVFSSPSVQIDLLPDGEVVVRATHEQVLSGSDGQIYTGCVFPADPAYAAQLGRYGQAIGESLAPSGVTGRASVDFAAARDESGRWSLYALEVNLRKGGTTHPYAALRNLVPGRYDAAAGGWVAQDGSPRVYRSTDNLVDESWIGMPAGAVIEAVRAAGLDFDHRSGTGVILHMLSGLGIDGRLGLTAFALDPAAAEVMYHSTCDVIARAADATQRTTEPMAR